VDQTAGAGHRQSYEYVAGNPLSAADPLGLCVGMDGTPQDRACTQNDFFWAGLPAAIASQSKIASAGFNAGSTFGIGLLTNNDAACYGSNPEFWVEYGLGVVVQSAAILASGGESLGLEVGAPAALKAGAEAAAGDLRMSGSSVVGGFDHATQAMIKYSAKNSEEGLFDVIGHGTPNDIAGQSPSQIADRIRVASDGQDIRLLSCQTGCSAGTFAQDLADELGVRVKAPTSDIASSGRGNTLNMFGGDWRWFDPIG